MLSKKHRLTAMQSRKDNTVDDVKEMKEIMQELQADRISEGDFRKQKIEQFQAKKAVAAELEVLKTYEDEETKRKFFMAQIKYSIMNTFEQMKMVEMELQILAHRATLTAE